MHLPYINNFLDKIEVSDFIRETSERDFWEIGIRDFK